MIIAGCSDNNSTSVTGGGVGVDLAAQVSEVTTACGATGETRIHVTMQTRGTVGDAILVELRFRVGGNQPGQGLGTLHWGDNTDSRVRDTVRAYHRYNAAGTYTLAFQPDGCEKVVIGSVVITSAATDSVNSTSCLGPGFSGVVGNVPAFISPGSGHGGSLRFQVLQDAAEVVDASVMVTLDTAPTDPQIDFYLSENSGSFVPTNPATATIMGSGDLFIYYVASGLSGYMNTSDTAILNYTVSANYLCDDGSTETTSFSQEISINIGPFPP